LISKLFKGVESTVEVMWYLVKVSVKVRTANQHEDVLVSYKEL